MTAFKTALAAVLLARVGLPALAQADTLPDFAYDMLSEVTFATTAEAQCDGVKTRPAKLQQYILDMYTKLAAQGVSATDAVKHFETETTTAQIATRDANLRVRHGVAAEGAEAFCAAIRAEAKVNRPFAKLLRIR